MSVLIKSFERQCPICMEDFETNDRLIVMPCSHFGHETCVQEATEIDGRCFMCRTIIESKCCKCKDVIMIDDKRFVTCLDCHEAAVYDCFKCHRGLKVADHHVKCSDCFIESDKYKEYLESLFKEKPTNRFEEAFGAEYWDGYNKPENYE